MALKCNTTFGYNYTYDPPDGNIVAWHDSQMFSSEKKTSNNKFMSSA